jgi:hypothetical protein
MSRLAQDAVSTVGWLVVATAYVPLIAVAGVALVARKAIH